MIIGKIMELTRNSAITQEKQIVFVKKRSCGQKSSQIIVSHGANMIIIN